MNTKEQEFSRNIARYIGCLEKRRKQFLNNRLGVYQLKGSMFLMLLYMDKHPDCSQDDLVEFIGIDKSGIARKCRTMEDLEYIRREPLEDNRRQYRLALTERGSGLLPVIRELLLDWSKSITRDMSRAEQEEMIRLLEMMADNAAAISR